MHIDKLTFSILRAIWAIEPQLALSYAGFISKLITHNLESVEEKLPLAAYAFTENGDRLMMYEDNNGKQVSMFDSFPEASTAIIPLKGTMLKEDTWCSYGTESIASVMKEAAAHKNIKCLVMEGDTGGGAVDSIFPIIDARNFAKKMGKPIVGSGDTIGSAGYYAFSCFDLIVAQNDISSAFGSIGVVASFQDVQPYYEKLGVKFHKVYAPESDAKNQAFDLALKGDYSLIKSELLSPLARKFQADVRAFRAGKIDITQKGILNGKMFFAQDAVKFGLADEIGNLEHAIKRANELAKSN